MIRFMAMSALRRREFDAAGARMAELLAFCRIRPLAGQADQGTLAV